MTANVSWHVREIRPGLASVRFKWEVRVHVAAGRDDLGEPYASRRDLVATFDNETDANEYVDWMNSRQAVRP